MFRNKLGPIALLLILMVLTYSCIRPAKSRAERDQLVGIAATNGHRVEVIDGLAVIREFSPGKLVLWANAPSFVAEVDTPAGAPQMWSIEVHNAMPGATLTQDEQTLQSASTERPTLAIFSVTLRPGEITRITVKPPQSQDHGRHRIAAMSDVQEGIDEVQDLFAAMNDDPKLEFLLGAGDLTITGSNEELDAFEAALRGLQIPYYTTLGNHEIVVSDPQFQTRFGRSNSHFVYRGVHYTLLDSASATIDPLVYDWIDNWMALGAHATHVVAMHIPPTDPIGVRNGSFASRNEASKLLNKLVQGNVDLTIYGHIHSYYSFDNAGIPAHISGGGGALPEKFDGVGRHYLSIDIDPDTAVLETSVVEVD